MKKVLMIIGGIVLGVVVIVSALYIYTYMSSDKLVCKSKEGNITIMYKDDKLTGYTAKGISYDFDNQKAYAKKMGGAPYAAEFANWFEDNTSGTCEFK